jgi:hypothetical protein
MSKRKPARTIKARSASKIRSKAVGSGQSKGRANSKQARVLALLCGPNGATIATVTRSTGWQETRLPGWGGRTRTSEWRNQNPPISPELSMLILKKRRNSTDSHVNGLALHSE